MRFFIGIRHKHYKCETAHSLSTTAEIIVIIIIIISVRASLGLI